LKELNCLLFGLLHYYVSIQAIRHRVVFMLLDVYGNYKSIQVKIGNLHIHGLSCWCA
jgi:hypothetical protein